MIIPMTSTDPLVDVLATRLRRLDLIGWQQVTTWAEESELSFEDLRLLLALALKADEGPTPVTELAELAGFSLDVGYPAIHGLRRRGYLHEERRLYSLSEEGRELIKKLEDARREGIRAYLEALDPDEQQRLRDALVV